MEAVVVGGGWLARLLKVGSVELLTGGRVIRLSGVWHPEAFAEQIRVAKATARTVASAG
jgi:hypothetical protein